MDDSLQPTIDMLLNLSVFMWFGAVCPWSSFLHNDVIPIHRLIFLGILILLLRRLPIVFAMHKWIQQIELVSQAAFVGFFGPIGVGAIFYLSVSLEYLRNIKVDGENPEDVKQVMETIQLVVWFLVICSIVRLPQNHINIYVADSKQVVHGLSVPVGKAGYNLPRTISNAISTSTHEEQEPIPISNIPHTHSTATPLSMDDGSSYRSRKREFRYRSETPHPPHFRIGGSVIADRPAPEQPGVGGVDEPDRSVNLIVHQTRSGETRS